MKNKIILFSILLPFLSILSCGYSSLKIADKQEADSRKKLSKISKDAIITWEFIKTSVMDTCMKCHVNHSRPELGELRLVQLKMAKVLDDVKTNAMPPAKHGYSPLDNCRKQILEVWAENKAPEVTNIKVGTLSECQSLAGDDQSPKEELPLSQMPLNYETLFKRILQPNCVNCHNPDAEDVEAAGILFYPFEEIKDREDLWEGPGASSKMINTLVSTDEDKRMPRPIKPKEFKPLTAEEIDYIVRWIDAGKPN